MNLLLQNGMPLEHASLMGPGAGHFHGASVALVFHVEDIIDVEDTIDVEVAWVVTDGTIGCVWSPLLEVIG